MAVILESGSFFTVLTCLPLQKINKRDLFFVVLHFLCLFFLLEVMSPIKYHGEIKSKRVHFRMTPTGVRLLNEKYIGPGKLVDNMATFFEELAIGTIVAIPASVGPLFGMHDAESTIGTMITDLTHQLEQAKKTISDMETIVEKASSTRPCYKAFDDLGPSGKRKRCTLLESKVKASCKVGL